VNVGSRIYLDNSASTRVHPAVVEAMLPYFTEDYGNPSSLHAAGREAKEAVERSRATLAGILGAQPQEIVFTSGGTEANNLALKGVAFANRERGRHLVISAIEHDSILNPCRWLAAQGFRVTCIPVDEFGRVNLEELAKAIGDETILVSIMHANNEIGTIQPIAEIGELCRERGVYFHSDACQSFTQLPIDVRESPFDLLTINAHKIHGPKGVGALFIRDGVTISPWQQGGGHERGLRSSTENVPGIVGFAAAAELCRRERDTQVARITALRDRIIHEVVAFAPEAYLNGHSTERLPNNVNLGFRGLEGQAIRLLLELDDAGIAVSSGSACSSNQAENQPSHVLRAIGRNPVEARGALRVSLGRDTTKQEVDCFLSSLSQVLDNMRTISTVG
jgi:cysteine desulfurase